MEDKRHQHAVITRMAIVWDCPCGLRNLVESVQVPLCRDQSKALLVASGAMTEADELPEDFGLGASLNVVEEPERVTCDGCGRAFAALPMDPAWEQIEGLMGLDGGDEVGADPPDCQPPRG